MIKNTIGDNHFISQHKNLKFSIFKANGILHSMTPEKILKLEIVQTIYDVENSYYKTKFNRKNIKQIFIAFNPKNGLYYVVAFNKPNKQNIAPSLCIEKITEYDFGQLMLFLEEHAPNSVVKFIYLKHNYPYCFPNINKKAPT